MKLIDIIKINTFVYQNVNKSFSFSGRKYFKLMEV